MILSKVIKFLIRSKIILHSWWWKIIIWHRWTHLLGFSNQIKHRRVIQCQPRLWYLQVVLIKLPLHNGLIERQFYKNLPQKGLQNLQGTITYTILMRIKWSSWARWKVDGRMARIKCKLQYQSLNNSGPTITPVKARINQSLKYKQWWFIKKTFLLPRFKSFQQREIQEWIPLKC